LSDVSYSITYCKRERTDVQKSEIVCYFSGAVGEAVGRISAWEDIWELRLRVNRPLAVSMGRKIYYVTEGGQLTYNSGTAVVVSEQDMRQCFDAVCRYSVHSFQREIAQGFITVKGGHRVGFCGTPVIRSGAVENIKNISSINFRIARQVIGCGEKLYSECFSEGLCNILIAGRPSGGKTTVLRDLARLLGRSFRTALIDERGELAAVSEGVPQNDIGINTDVFDGYGKAAGISAAVRVMSPQIIICDEIGSEEDFAAVREAAGSGVYIAASIHAADMEDIKRRCPYLDIFDRIVFLSDMGKISSIVKRGGGYG